MIPIYIGYDTRERIAWHVLAHSIIQRSSLPVALIPVGNTVTPRPIWWREKGPHDSTEFSNARFAVPALAAYEGWAIFMDCDMLCMGDIADLWSQRRDEYAVMVVKHDHKPKERRKFLGAEQTVYPYKNWSSLMLVNCAHPHCRALTPEYINAAPGLDLHGFAWTTPDAVGEISGLWNVLTTGHGKVDLLHPELPRPGGDIRHIHYTRGGPWHGVRDVSHHAWSVALTEMLAQGNPKAVVNRQVSEEAESFQVIYRS